MTQSNDSDPDIVTQITNAIQGIIDADVQGIQGSIELLQNLTQSINDALGVGQGSDPFQNILSQLSSLGDAQTNLSSYLDAIFGEVYDLKNFVEQYYNVVNGTYDATQNILTAIYNLQNPTQIPSYLQCVISAVCVDASYSYEDLGQISGSGTSSIVYTSSSQTLVGVLAVVLTSPLPLTVSLYYGNPNILRLGMIALGLAETTSGQAMFSPVEFRFSNQFFPSPLPNANLVYWHLPDGLEVELYAYLKTVTPQSPNVAPPPESA